MTRPLLPGMAVLLMLLASSLPAVAVERELPLEITPLFLLKMDWPVPANADAMITASGATVISFIAPSTYLVAAKTSGFLTTTLPVVSLQPLLPENKILPILANSPATMLLVHFAGTAQNMRSILCHYSLQARSWGSDHFFIHARGRDIASLPQVYWVDPAPVPVLSNDNAARTLGTRQMQDDTFHNDGNSLWSYKDSSNVFEGTTGEGVTVSIVDTGIDGTHPAFNNRKLDYIDYGTGNPWEDQNAGNGGHGTMCAGIVAGDGAWRAQDWTGQRGKYAGMAPGAGLIGQAIFTGWTDMTTLCTDAYDMGADLTSNSWSYIQYYGYYLSYCAEYDASVRDASLSQSGDQPLTVVFAAANEGPNAMTVGAPGTAKNVITVGATGNDRDGSGMGYISSSSITYFSSRGPCLDGRIKPDVCAPGIDTYTTSAEHNVFKNTLGMVPDDNDASSYFAGGGTSAACPYTAGACALVYDYWRTNHGTDPSPALTKALLINGAEVLPSYTYPGYDQGWGRVNVSRSLISKPTRNILWEDQANRLATGETVSKVYKVTGSTELKISLVWTDVPGNPSATKALVNDLDLVITDPDGNVYRGNRFTGGISVPGGDADSLNNVEGFRVPAPKDGLYTVNVTGSSVPQGPQDYCLVLSGVLKEITSDLAAEAISWNTPAPVEGDTVIFNFTVANRGKTVSENVPCCVTVDGNTLSESIIGPLAVGASGYVETLWTAIRGNHAIALVIDPRNQTDELSETNNRVSGDLTVLHFGVSVSADPASLKLDPGASAQFSAQVLNEGTASDTFWLAFSTAAPGWTGVASAPSVTVGAGLSASLVLNISAPAIALAGETAGYSFSAISAGNSSYADSKTVKATANQIFDIGLDPASGVTEIFPWESAEFNITVKNRGNGLDTITLDLADPPANWQSNVSTGSLSIPARTDGAVKVSVKPPPVALAGTSSGLILTANSLGNVSSNATVKVTVKQFYNLSMDLLMKSNSTLPGGSLDGVFFIRNTGNGPDNVALGMVLEQGWDAAFDRTYNLTGYGTQGGNLTVRIPKDALAGDYRASFFVRSHGAITKFATFNVRVEQVFGVVTVSSPRREALFPGERATFIISVINTGNGNDTFDISPEGLPGEFTVENIGGPVHLGPRAAASARMSLNALSSAPSGEQTLTFRAISKKNPLTFNFSSALVELLQIPLPPVIRHGDIMVSRSVTIAGPELCGLTLMFSVVCACGFVMFEYRERTRRAVLRSARGRRATPDSNRRREMAPGYTYKYR